MNTEKINNLKSEFNKLREEDNDDFCRSYARHEFELWVKDTYPNDYQEIISLLKTNS